MRAILAQLDPVAGDPAAGVAAVRETLAAHPAAELAVFPELFLGGYDLARLPDIALEAGGDVLRELCDAARRAGCAVVTGFAERLPGGGIANSVACVDADGSWSATYRKTHLFGREAGAFVAGDELVVCELAGRVVGPLVCFDMEFPEPARALAGAGAELLVTCSANMDPWAPEHDLAGRARALDNRLPHLYVNRVGTEGGLRFAGGSMAVAADGSPLAVAAGTPAVLDVDLDLDAAVPADVDYLRLARPGLPVEHRTSIRGGTL